MMAETTDKLQVADLVEICQAKGMTDVVICPGSRDAPLIIAFGSHENITTHHIVDERSAGFFALGMSLQQQRPVGLVCSSGSAVVNFSPAIVEAFLQGVPLIVMTADRPKEWTGQMVGQTMDQKNVFSNFIKASFELNLNFNDDLDKYYNQRVSNEALNLALSNKNGPVHINIPLAEPLYNQKSYDSKVKYIRSYDSFSDLNEGYWEELISEWEASSKILILIGQHTPSPVLEQRLLELSSLMNVVIVAENIANVQLPHGINCIDRTLLGFMEKDELIPDLLITMGDAIVSKKMKAFLRAHSIRNHWRINVDDKIVDTFQSLTRKITYTPEKFIKTLLEKLTIQPQINYRSVWKNIDFKNRDEQYKYMSGIPFSDLKCFHTIHQIMPENCNVHLGNSSVIRYSQLFDSIPKVNYFGNRGVSGIDGSLSTAIGYSSYAKKMNIMITGDLSFMYDSNALWIESMPKNLKIILVNNGGGGIFKIIPGPNSTEQYENGFVANHERQFSSFIESFNIDYRLAENEVDLEKYLTRLFYETNSTSILEVNTESIDNKSVLHDYFNFLNQ